MPRILFYDTETTGKLDFKKPITDPCQPKIMQMGVMLDDELKNIVHQFAYIIKPYYEWKSEYEEAVSIHGITYETAMKYGVPIEQLFQSFKNLLLNADLCVCHNVAYDSKVIQHTLLTKFQGKTLPELP
ncbi:MAG: 3'-5' exonuclease, partial [Gammaproteobacteria bacterium]|nr:3'-5' exonuclease [Gammaproteobacteria bacterium]